MKHTEDDDFDEESWNDGRILREEGVVSAAMELVRYMGCNHVTIPVPNQNIEIKIVPKESV